jgi:hypothetical protein
VTSTNKNPVGLDISGIAAGTGFTVSQNCLGTFGADPNAYGDGGPRL